jgi:hypothetical protein
MRRSLLAAAVFTMLAAAAGAQAQMAAIGDISLTGDADRFEAVHVRAGALTDYQSPFRYAGIAAQMTHYTRSGWSADAPAVLFLWRNQHRETLAGTLAEGGVVRVAGKIRPIGDATWSSRPAARTSIELLASSDLVETQRAVENATAYTFGAASIEQDLSKRFTVIGLAGVQHFTDGNERVHLRGRLIWLLVPEQGVSVQLRWRQYHSRLADVGDAYFNPGRYREWQGALAMRKRYAGFVWSGTLAAGQEEIEGSIRHGTRLAEVRAEGTLRKGTRLALYASYNRSAGFGTADNYWYRSAGVTLIVPF